MECLRRLSLASVTVLLCYLVLVSVVTSREPAPRKDTADKLYEYEDFDLGRELKEKTIFDILLELREARTEKFDAAFNELIESSLEQHDEYWPELEGLISRSGLYAPGDDTYKRCGLCRVIVFVAWVGLFRYENFTERVISFCESVTESTPIRGDPLCRGAILLHMPHINETLHKKLSPINTEKWQEICQFQNSCPIPDAPTAAPTPPLTPPTYPPTEPPTAEPPNPPITAELPDETTVNVEAKAEEKKTGRSFGDGGARPRRAAGVQPENSISVVQLTDIHFEKNYAVGSNVYCGLPVCCVMVYGSGNAGPLGDYRCNIPPKTMEIFIDKVASMNPDVVLFSGDIPPHTIWEETEESQRECSETLVNVLNTSLPGHRVYPNIGNHEMYPTNLFSFSNPAILHTKSFLAWYTNLWKPLADFSEANEDSLRLGGYYTKLIRPGLRIVSFNTNLVYTFNWYNFHNHKEWSDFPPGLPPQMYPSEYKLMTDFVEKALKDAFDSGEKVLLLGHHPPGGADYLVEGSRWYRQLILNYKDIIVLQPTGHTHYDEYRLIYDDANTPVSVVYVSPCMTTMGTRNPSMRIYYLDNSSYELLDYEQYFIDLPNVLSGGIPDDWTTLIKPLYSAKDEYELPDLSPQSWHDLLSRFRTDSALHAKHYGHEQANARSPRSLSRCDTNCLETRICRLSNVNYDERQLCESRAPPSSITRPPWWERVPIPSLPTPNPNPATTPSGATRIAGSLTSMLLVSLVIAAITEMVHK